MDRIGQRTGFLEFFLSSRGRIGRKSFFLGLFLLDVAVAAVWAALLGVSALILSFSAGSSAKAFSGGLEAAMMGLGLSGLPIHLKILLSIPSIFLYPMLILAIKRLHDRGKSGFWSILLVLCVAGWSFVVSLGTQLLISMFLYFFSSGAANMLSQMLPMLMGGLVFLAAAIPVLYGYFLAKGDAGENRFGARALPPCGFGPDREASPATLRDVLFSFEGRLEFSAWLLSTLVVVAIYAGASAAASKMPAGFPFAATILLSSFGGVCRLLAVWILSALATKRLHAVGKSGLAAIPLAAAAQICASFEGLGFNPTLAVAFSVVLFAYAGAFLLMSSESRSISKEEGGGGGRTGGTSRDEEDGGGDAGAPPLDSSVGAPRLGKPPGGLNQPRPSAAGSSAIPEGAGKP